MIIIDNDVINDTENIIVMIIIKYIVVTNL